ncbi:CBS domain-containing protein [Clostridium gasigenes]|uniref:CBS domain-containing protein n=1 Tax=Clostridium gasigenes TaxID=94869 RepID=A0A7X0SF51_9CLOT|nr:CBS domain-containing protein [Clostridium gasigenes]MBB6716480.1 CBS domain-containing protein [Clostridium gasigenes]
MKIGGIVKLQNNTVKENDSIDEVLQIMNNLNMNGIPVIDDSNNLVGMVVKADIYRFRIAPGHYDSCPVEWVMSKSVVFAQADEDVLTVAKRLRENGIISMPIVENEKIMGVVSIEDLLDYFVDKEKKI